MDRVDLEALARAAVRASWLMCAEIWCYFLIRSAVTGRYGSAAVFAAALGFLLGVTAWRAR